MSMTEAALRALVEAIDLQTARTQEHPNGLGYVKLDWIEPALTNARAELKRKHPMKGTAFDGIEPDWNVAAMIVGKEEAGRKRAEWQAAVS